ncbi:MAG: hypothetical protein U1E76_14275 [Planctomycetota bacterium]
MAQLFYVHWHDAELEQRIAPLRAAGHGVTGHSTATASAPLKDPLPDALIVSLARLPSHGRAIAEWFWEAKKRQGIPLIFVDGERDKVQATRAKFPRAKFCSSVRLLSTVARALNGAPRTATPIKRGVG